MSQVPEVDPPEQAPSVPVVGDAPVSATQHETSLKPPPLDAAAQPAATDGASTSSREPPKPPALRKNSADTIRDELLDIHALDGLLVSGGAQTPGHVLAIDGAQLGILVSGSLAECAGRQVLNGQVLNDDQVVIGTVEVVPRAAALAAAKASMRREDVDPLKILEGLRVSRDGSIRNGHNVIVGTVRTREINDCHGRHVGKKGQICNSKGRLLAVAKLYNRGTEILPQPSRGSSASRAARVVTLESIAGAKIDQKGYISFAGRRVAKVVEGEIEKLKLRHVDAHGRVYTSKEKYLGKVALLDGLSIDLSRDDPVRKSGPKHYDGTNSSHTKLLQDLSVLSEDEILARETAAATRSQELRQRLRSTASEIRTIEDKCQAREQAINFFTQVNKAVENEGEDGPTALHHHMKTVVEGLRKFAKAHGVNLE